MVAPTKIIAGLGISLGIDRLHAPGTTGSSLSVCMCAFEFCTVLRRFQLLSKSSMTEHRTAAVLQHIPEAWQACCTVM